MLVKGATVVYVDVIAYSWQELNPNLVDLCY